MLAFHAARHQRIVLLRVNHRQARMEASLYYMNNKFHILISLATEDDVNIQLSLVRMMEIVENFVEWYEWIGIKRDVG